MPRTPRQESESKIYHFFARGSGRQLIYEDNQDRREFMGFLASASEDNYVELFAYCLMGNHYHIVLRADYDDLSAFAHDVNRKYASYFNRRHARTGHLFQNRFSTEPINSDSYFLEAVRYVHRNPVEAGISQTCRYPWSSYSEYLDKSYLVNTKMILSMLGGVEAFQKFHLCSGKMSFEDDNPLSSGISEADVLSTAKAVLEGKNPGSLKSLSKAERNQNLRKLKSSGMSLAQISLITGISPSTVWRA